MRGQLGRGRSGRRRQSGGHSGADEGEGVRGVKAPALNAIPLRELVSEARGGFASGARDPAGIVQLRMNNVTSDGSLDWSSLTRVPADRSGIEAYKLQPGDVLFNATNSAALVGKTALFVGYPEPVVFRNHFTRVRSLRNRLLPEYLAFWLQAQWRLRVFERICDRWIGQAAVQRDKLLDLAIPCPSLAEQRRVTARLTEQLAAVEGARAAAQEMVTAAATLRAGQVRSALATGESGEWPRRRLGEICHIQLGKMLSPKSKTGSEPRKYLRNANVQWDRFQLVDVAEMDFTEGETEKFELQRGDLLVCEGGEPGRSAVWQAEIEPCFYQKALHRLRPRVEGVNPRFLLYRMWLGAASGEFSGSHAKTTIAHLPAVRLAELEIGLPSIETQSAMVRALDEGAEVCRRLESQALSELAAISALPAALMREAFNSGGVSLS